MTQIAALASALAVLAFTRVWHAEETYQESDEDDGLGGDLGGVGGDSRRPRTPGNEADAGNGESVDARVLTRARADADRDTHDGPLDVFRAYAPYLAIIVVFVLASRVPAITGKAPAKVGTTGTGLESVTHIVNWPGLHILKPNGDPVRGPT